MIFIMVYRIDVTSVYMLYNVELLDLLSFVTGSTDKPISLAAPPFIMFKLALKQV